jgi:hypothetical protein
VEQAKTRPEFWLRRLAEHAAAKTGCACQMGQNHPSADEDDYDLRLHLRQLQQLGYTCSVALQGCGIKGDMKENLTRSKSA